jgi:hypothetical protein
VLCKPSLVFYASRKVFFFFSFWGSDKGLGVWVGMVRDYFVDYLFFFDGSGSLSPGGFGFAAELVNCFGGKCNVL